MADEYVLGPVGNALSGAVGGVVSNAAVYPLDTVKTRIQAEKKSKSSGAQTKKGLDKFVTEFKALAKEQGAPGLYRGLNASLTNSFVMQFAYFYWYTVVRNGYAKWQFPGTENPSLSTAAELSLGALAGAISQVFVTPVSVVATQQQLSNTETSVTKTSKAILKDDGITGFWRGLKPSLVLVINPAITYGAFERLKPLFTTGSAKITPFQSFILGALSKSLATVVTYPYIMAKVRLQASYTDEDAKAGAVRYTNSIDVLARVAKERGLKGWYAGMSAQIFKAVLAQALLFGLKDIIGEYVLRFLLALSKVAGRPLGLNKIVKV